MLYAAYGSNLHPERLRRRLASARLEGTAALPGYALHFHKRSVDGSGKCSIMRGSDGVYVAIYDVSDSDLRRLDAIEGVGTGYDALRIEVPGYGECASYSASRDFIDDRLQPYDWYREMVIRGCRLHGFPVEYCRRVVAVDAMPDPDARRSEENWAIVRALSAIR